MVIYVKPGTHSAQFLEVPRKRKLPIVGEKIKTRTPGEKYEKLKGWIVREIKQMPFGVPMYVLERW